MVKKAKNSQIYLQALTVVTITLSYLKNFKYVIIHIFIQGLFSKRLHIVSETIILSRATYASASH